MSTAVRRSIYGKLAGDVTLGNLLAPAAAGYAHAIYHNQAPDDALFPLVVFNKSSGVPTQAFGDPAAFDTDIWQIKAIDRNSTADNAEAISERIRTLLNDANLSISGGTLMFLRRESDIEYPEESEGITYLHVGSLYRLVADLA